MWRVGEAECLGSPAQVSEEALWDEDWEEGRRKTCTAEGTELRVPLMRMLGVRLSVCSYPLGKAEEMVATGHPPREKLETSVYPNELSLPLNALGPKCLHLLFRVPGAQGELPV